jgi:hypothetical protein
MRQRDVTRVSWTLCGHRAHTDVTVYYGDCAAVWVSRTLCGHITLDSGGCKHVKQDIVLFEY